MGQRALRLPPRRCRSQINQALFENVPTFPASATEGAATRRRAATCEEIATQVEALMADLDA
jgi:hypothetical protein